MRQLTITKQITNRTEESVGRYFLEVTRYPLITPEEEVELTVKIREGDQKALERLVVANLRFVISVAKQYQNQGLSFMDLINEGNVGLIKAATKFDEKRGFKFISYAVWWIRQSIIMAISEQTRVVRLPINRLSSINKIKRAIPYLEQELEREPTDYEIAEFLDISPDDVEIAQSIKKHHISFDKPLNGNSESDFSLYDVVQSGNMPQPDEELISESLEFNIIRALSKLTKRESSIIQLCFGLAGKPISSLDEIGIKFGLTSERVRQIRNTSLIKLRSLLSKSKTLIKD